MALNEAKQHNSIEPGEFWVILKIQSGQVEEKIADGYQSVNEMGKQNNKYKFRYHNTLSTPYCYWKYLDLKEINTKLLHLLLFFK